MARLFVFRNRKAIKNARLRWSEELVCHKRLSGGCARQARQLAGGADGGGDPARPDAVPEGFNRLLRPHWGGERG